MDQDLVELARRGDRDAFAVLVHQVSDPLFAIAFRILRDADLAEDALQDALITTWRQLPKLRETDRFEAWIRRILVHACYAEAGRRRRWSTSRTGHPGRTTHRRPMAASGSRTGTNWNVASSGCPVEQRAIVVLHHYLGLPLVEIAETLGIPAGTARSRLHYATRALRTAMEADAAYPAQGARPA